MSGPPPAGDAAAARFVMLRTGRFQEIQQNIASQLTVVDAGSRAARRHLRERYGWGRLIREWLARPTQADLQLAEANVTRKAARFPGLARMRWLTGLYRRGKARHARMARILLADVFAAQPDAAALVYNGTVVPDSVLAEVAGPGRRLFIENGYFAGTVQADPQGINADNSLPRDPAFYLSYTPREDAAPELNFRAPKHAVHDRAPLPEGCIFVPFQVESDMQVTRLSPWIKTMAQFHSVLVSMAEQLPEVHFVVKEHPYSRRILHGNVSEHPRILFQNGRDTRELLEGCAAVLTLNSTVGIEALSLGRKVVTLGEACYVIDGLVRAAGNEQELSDVLSALPAWQPDPELRRRFLAYLTGDFLLGTASAPFDERTAERLLARLHGQSPALLPPSGD